MSSLLAATGVVTSAGAAAAQTPALVAAAPPILAAPAAVATPRLSGMVEVRISTPRGVAVNVVLRKGQTRAVATKLPSGTAVTRRVPVVFGTHGVQARPVTFGGRLYVGTASPASVPVVKGRAAPVVRVVYRAAPIASLLDVVSITATSTTLSWVPVKGAPVQLRRSLGTVAPTSVRLGVPVALSTSGAVDETLRPSTAYSYALFTSVKGVWSPPLTLTINTPASTPNSAAFSLSSTTLVLRAGSVYAVAPVPGGIAVTLDGQVVAPVVGSVVVLPTSATLDNGYLGRVTAVSADGRTITLVQAALDEAFDYLDVSTTGSTQQPRTSALHPRRAQLPARSRSSWPIHRAAQDVLPTFPEQMAGCGDVDKPVTVTPSLDVAWDHNDFAFHINKNFRAPTSARMSLWLQVTLTGTIDVEGEVAVSCALHLPELRRPFAIGPVPFALVVSPEVKMAATAEVSGQVSVSTTLGLKVQAKIGLGGTSLSGSPILTSTVHDRSVSVEGSLHAAVEGELVFGPGTVTPGAAKVDSGVVAGVSAKLAVLDAALVGHVYPRACAEVTATSGLDFALVMRAWFKNWHVEKELHPSWAHLEHEWLHGLVRPAGCDVPEPTPSPTPPPSTSPTPSPSASAEPTTVPTPGPEPTAEPTAEPTVEPTAEPTPTVTPEPTPVPTPASVTFKEYPDHQIRATSGDLVCPSCALYYRADASWAAVGVGVGPTNLNRGYAGVDLSSIVDDPRQITSAVLRFDQGTDYNDFHGDTWPAIEVHAATSGLHDGDPTSFLTTAEDPHLIALATLTPQSQSPAGIDVTAEVRAWLSSGHAADVGFIFHDTVEDANDGGNHFYRALFGFTLTVTYAS